MFVLQVAVDGLRAADNLHAIVVCGVVFGEHASVGVRVVATDDDYGLDAEFADDFEAAFKLAFLLELGASRADEVEAARVAVFVDEFVGQFDILVVHETAGAHEEAVELVLLVLFLEFVVEAADHVVSAGSLAAREDDTDVHRSVSLLLFRGHELHEGHAVGVGEELLDVFLVAHALGGVTFFDAHIATEACGQFGLIGSTCNLQCAFFHKADKMKKGYLIVT